MVCFAGHIKFKQEEYENAISDYSLAIQKSNSFLDQASYYASRANVYEQLNNYKETMEDLKRAIILSQELPYATDYIGQCAYISAERGYYENAIYYYTEALKRIPNKKQRKYHFQNTTYSIIGSGAEIDMFSLLSIGRGDAKYALGRYQEAIADYDSALAEYPNWKPAQDKKALALNTIAEQNSNVSLNITNSNLTNFQVQKTKLLVSQYITLLNSFQYNTTIQEQSMLIGLFEDRNLMVFNDLDKSIEYEEIYAYLMRLKINRGKYQFQFHESPENQEVSIYKEKYSSLVISKTIQTQTGSQKIKLRFIIKPESNKIVGIAKES